MEPSYYNYYDTISISYYGSFEYRLCTDISLNTNIRPYIIIKHIYDTAKNYHITSLLTPISQKTAINAFYNRYNCDFLKQINLTPIL